MPSATQSPWVLTEADCGVQYAKENGHLAEAYGSVVALGASDVGALTAPPPN
ncbi:hypothetical protein K227x_13340 [Rubripirellula lacrimiformis]|uniref:Uncharacterized protein n=1 Tax=Rubripirellula lacrimiformis TaxID=1930273 RepID=A0A517N752_9BACT|nr:hypothetical protein K227x_13340 [Rubripirellula lacrimiformis]